MTLKHVHGSLEVYPGVDDLPGRFQYPGGVLALACRCLGKCLPDGGEYIILMGRLLGRIEWEPLAQPEVVFVIPQGHAKEVTQDHVVVGVFTGVLDGHIL